VSGKNIAVIARDRRDPVIGKPRAFCSPDAAAFKSKKLWNQKSQVRLCSCSLLPV